MSVSDATSFIGYYWQYLTRVEIDIDGGEHEMRVLLNGSDDTISRHSPAMQISSLALFATTSNQQAASISSENTFLL